MVYVDQRLGLSLVKRAIVRVQIPSYTPLSFPDALMVGTLILNQLPVKTVEVRLLLWEPLQRRARRISNGTTHFDLWQHGLGHADYVSNIESRRGPSP